MRMKVGVELKRLIVGGGENVGGGDDIAVVVGDGQDIGDHGTLAASISNPFTAFLGERVTPVQIQNRQIQFSLDDLHAVLPNSFYTASQLISAGAVMSNCSHWQSVCSRYST